MQIKSLATIAVYRAFIKGYTVNKLGEVYSPKGVKLKLRCLGDYKCFSIKVLKKVYPLRVHQLIAFIKYGNKIFENDCVRHLDGNSLNNSWGNIKIGSHSDNAFDIPENARKLRASKGFKKYDHALIFRLHEEGLSYKEIMYLVGIKSKSTINHIVNKSFTLANAIENKIAE